MKKISFETEKGERKFGGKGEGGRIIT
jgi:hypothetical protein